MLWLITLFGFTSLNISINEAFNKINILKYLIPDEVDIKDPPISVKNNRNNEKFLPTFDT